MEFFSNLLASLPGAVAQGLIWGLMAIGVYITFKVLDLADLTVDGTMATGGAVCLVLMTHGVNLWVALLCAFLAGMLAGLVTGVLHTFMGIPAILAGILTQLALFSVNLDFNKVLGLMISNGLVALASALYCQYQGFADVNAGRGAIVIGLAAVIIGEVVFSRIFRNFALKLLSVALGAVIYYIVIQFVLTAGLNTNDLKLITALVVAIFLAIPYWKGKYFRAAVKTKKEGR